MELKLKEVGKEFSVELKDGIKIRPFLYLGEMGGIVDQCLATDSQIVREMLKVVLVAKCCTNIDFEENIDRDVYDFCTELQIVDDIEDDVSNFYKIDILINRSESIVQVANMIVDTISKKVDGFNVSDIITQLKEVDNIDN